MKVLGFVLVLLIGLTLTNCCTSQKNSASMPKTLLIDNAKTKLIASVTYQKWNAGQQQGGFGYYIEVSQPKNKLTLQLEHIYFRGLKGEIKLGKKGYKANLKNASDKDNSSLPDTLDIPFLLNDNECVISYINNDTVKFIKVVNLIEKATVNFPSVKPRNKN